MLHLFIRSAILSQQSLELAWSSTWWRIGAGSGDQNAQSQTPGVYGAEDAVFLARSRPFPVTQLHGYCRGI